MRVEKTEDGHELNAKSVVSTKVPPSPDGERSRVRNRVPSNSAAESVDERVFVVRLEKLRAPLLAALPSGGGAWDRSDIVQEILLELWRNDRLRSRSWGELVGYAKRAAAYGHSDGRRSELRCRRRETGWAFLEDDRIPEPDELLLRREEVELRWRLILSLPKALLDVVVVREIEDLTVPQFARVLGIPESLVSSRLRRGRRRLRRLLQRFAFLP